MASHGSLAAAYTRDRKNSIGFLRWVFASMVIVYHGYIIAAFSSNPVARVLHINLGRTAVLSFFILSGFLVARSYRSSSGMVDFLWKRVLRIFPGYWACLLVTACGLGLLSWIHSHGTYHGYLDVHPFRYVTGNWNLHVTSAAIPGTFGDTVAGDKINLRIANGSIWTLWYEFRCYLVIAVLGVAAALWQRRAVVYAVTGVLGIALVVQAVALQANPADKSISTALTVLMQPFADANMAGLLFAFLVGTCFALRADLIQLDDRVGVASIVLVLLIARWHGDFGTLAIAPLAYAIFWLGVRLPMTWWDRFGDSSYGVYVYGWPVQTLLAEYGLHDRVGIHLYLVVSIVLSTAIGLLSWHLLEKQALKLKRIDPYRWLRARVERRSQSRSRPAAGAGLAGPSGEDDVVQPARLPS